MKREANSTGQRGVKPGDPTAGSSDQRRSARQTFVSFAWYRLIDPGPQKAASGEESRNDEGVAHSCDLSHHGVGIVTAKPLPADSLIFLEIVTTAGNISAVGRIAHCKVRSDKTYRVGIRLLVVPPRDQGMMDRLINE